MSIFIAVSYPLKRNASYNDKLKLKHVNRIEHVEFKVLRLPDTVS